MMWIKPNTITISVSGQAIFVYVQWIRDSDNLIVHLRDGFRHSKYTKHKHTINKFYTDRNSLS